MKKQYIQPRAEIIRFATEQMLMNTSNIKMGDMNKFSTETEENQDSEGNFWID